MQPLREIQAAIFRQDYALVKRLLQQNAQLAYARDRDGRTILTLLALDEKPDLELIELAITLGTDLQSKDQDQEWTALHFAARDHKAGLVRLLLQNGAECDAVDRFGNTPLWRAVMGFEGDVTAIEALIRAGADPDRKNRSGISPRDLARDISHPELRAVLGV